MSKSYADHLNRFRDRRNEREKLFALFDQLDIKDLKNAKKCLCIGSGPGEFDLELIKRKVPNIEHIVAVDFDTDGLKRFEKNVIEKFSSAVLCETFQCPIEDWKFDDYAKFDVVLAFHFFNEIQNDVKMLVLDRCLQTWLKTFGLLIFNYITTDDVPGKPTVTILFQKFLRILDLRLKKNIEDLGGEIILSEKYSIEWDFREFDTDLLPMFRKYNEKLTEGELKSMLNLLPDGYGAQMLEFCVARKPYFQ